MINYIIGIGAFLVVAIVIKNFIKSTKSGGSCGCGCKTCPSKEGCSKDKK